MRSWASVPLRSCWTWYSNCRQLDQCVGRSVTPPQTSLRHAARTRSRGEDAHGQKKKQNLLGRFSVIYIFVLVQNRYNDAFLADYFQWQINMQLASGFWVQTGLNSPQDISIHYKESVEMNPQLCQSETVAAKEHWDVQPKWLKSALLFQNCSCLLHFAVEFTQTQRQNVFSGKWICSICKHTAVAQTEVWEQQFKIKHTLRGKTACTDCLMCSRWLCVVPLGTRSEKLLSIPEM